MPGKNCYKYSLYELDLGKVEKINDTKYFFTIQKCIEFLSDQKVYHKTFAKQEKFSNVA